MLLLSGVFVIRLVPTRRIAILALLAAGATIAGCDREKRPDGQAAPRQANISGAEAKGSDAFAKFRYEIERSHADKAAPTAQFIGPDDAPVTLAQFRGKPLLVNLWATWCVPCVAEMPTLDRLAADRADTMTIIAVAQDLQGAAVVDPWFQKAGLNTLQPFIDPRNALLDAANTALPTTIFYDATGREMWRVIGAIDWQGPEAQALLEEANRQP